MPNNSQHCSTLLNTAQQHSLTTLARALYTHAAPGGAFASTGAFGGAGGGFGASTFGSGVPTFGTSGTSTFGTGEGLGMGNLEL